MANTIKLKTGSGSDPSASDLVVGELAIRTDSGKIFLKKDNGAVAEVSGGGGIEDGDKGDITVSNGGDTFTIDSGVVTSAKIADDTIVNADINSSAAIAGTKISPNFGSQNITTTGHLSTKDIFLTDPDPTVFFTDSNDNHNYIIQVNSGQWKVRDTTNSVDRLVVNSDGHIDIAGNLDVGAGLDVTGDITGTGDLTLTSTDAGSSASPIIELYRNSASPADADYLGQLKFTGESDDGSKEVYAKVTGKIDDASSGTEDGLIEFALRKAGSNNIGARLTSTDLKLINGTGLEVAGNISCDGTVDGVDIAARNTLFGGLTSSSGVLTNGVTATTQSASDNSTKVATTAYTDTAISNLINGAPTALDTLNELAAAMNDDAAFSTTVTNSIATKLPLAGGTLTGNLDFGNSVRARFGSSQQLQILFDGNNSLISYGTGTLFATGSTFRVVNNGVSENIIWAKADAEVELYYNNSLKFETSNTGISVSGAIAVSGTVDGRDVATDGTKLDTIETNATADQTAAEIKTLLDSNGIVNSNVDASAAIAGTKISPNFGSQNITSGGIATVGNLSITNNAPQISFVDSNANSDFLFKLDGGVFQLRDTTNNAQRFAIASDGTTTVAQNLDVGAGIDVTGNITVTGTVDGRDVATDGTKLDGIEASATADQTASEILTLIKTVDGSGSGLDADTLDGISSASFLRSDADDTMTGNLTVNGIIYLQDQIRIGDDVFIEDYNAANAFRVKGNQDSNKGFIAFGSQTKKLGCDGASAALTYDGHEVVTQNSNLNASNLGSGTIPAARVPTLNQNTTGSAATLTTARTIAGVSFNGSANISLNNNAITNGAGYITSSGTSAACSGNAATATKLASARTIAGVSFDGSANISLNNNAITNGASYVTSSIINSLNASNLSSGTIPDARIADGAITTAKLAGSAVDSTKIADLTIGAGKLSSNAVTTAKINNGAVTNAKIDSMAASKLTGALPAIDGSALTGISAGATGGGSDEVFYENGQNVTTDYTITNGKNAMAAGPIEIQNGVTVTVGSGETLTIV